MPNDLSSIAEGGALAVGVEFSPTGLIMPDGLTIEEWVQAGHTVASVAGGVNWWIGDWLNAGDRQFGESYAQYVDILGLDPGTLSNIAGVASRFELPFRNGSLSWRHHQLIAYLPVERRAELMEKAEANGWSTRELREAIADSKALPSGNGSKGPTDAAPSTSEPAPPSAADEITEDLDPVAEWERAEQENVSLRAQVDALSSSDQGTELHNALQRVAALEGRNGQLINEKNAAVQRAKYLSEVCQQAARELGVETFGDIVAAIRDLKR